MRMKIKERGLRTKERRKRVIWDTAIISISLLVILNAVMFIKINGYSEAQPIRQYNQSSNSSFTERRETGERCPDAEGGLGNAFLQVKYFYSNFCPWCRKEEPILQKLVANYGNLVHIEWYNVRDCQELVTKYKVSGVPTSVFSTYGSQAEYSHYGFIYEKDLIGLVCDVAGGC